MKCNVCGEQLLKGDTRCPNCGSEVENKKDLRSQIKNWKRLAAIACCVAVLAVLAVVFVKVIGNDQNAQMGGDPTASTAPTGTVPPAGNPEDVTCKGSYLVSDEQSVRSADVVVATLGDATLTNSQLQIYYQMEIMSFVEQYSYYLAYIGLDPAQPLDQQPCTMMDGYTWHQYFLACALETWQYNQAMALEAKGNGFQMDSTYQERLDSVDENMTTNALLSGYETADAFLQSQCGANTTMADYKHYMEAYFNGYLYFTQCCEGIEKLDDEALSAYFQENKEMLEAQGIKQGVYTVDVRHILIKVEGGVENADGTITFPDEAVAAEAYAKAEKILQMYLDSPSEERFGQLAKEYTADGNGAQGGLYTGVEPGRMVKTFNDWCFDENRQAGDYGIVETRFGYHIMYFSARGEELWPEQTQQVYLAEQSRKLAEQVTGKYELKVLYEKIELAHVDLV